MTNNSHECFKNYETVYVNEEEKILYGVNNYSENNVNDVNENFELPLADASNSLNSCSSNSSTTTTSAIWTRKATSLLISLHSKYENNFNDSTTRNEQVWLKVCKDMEKEGHIYTAIQVENKFKYLKKLYMRKIDNMFRETGTSPINFEYFDEMDAIFGKKPNVVPAIVATSADGLQKRACSDYSDNNSENENSFNIRKTKKKNRVEKETETLLTALKEQEDRREQRHQERLALHQEAIDNYKDLMAKLIDKL